MVCTLKTAKRKEKDQRDGFQIRFIRRKDTIDLPVLAGVDESDLGYTFLLFYKYLTLCPVVIPVKEEFRNLWSSLRPISTGPLHALLHLYSRPINQVVYLGSYHFHVGNLILRLVSHLDAFSVYPIQT